jgi:3-phenylpropionate/trans-cinnamate dioxygenase ferredoxin reductase component
VVVGAGWIGEEVPASARQLGLEVTIIDPVELPDLRIFGREIDEFYRDVHAQHGVHLLLGEEIEAFEGNPRFGACAQPPGKQWDCDFAVVGIGVAPRVDLAKNAGLAVDNGVLVDERPRTSAPPPCTGPPVWPALVVADA